MADTFWWPVLPLLGVLGPPVLFTVFAEKKLFTKAVLAKVRWLRASFLFVGLLVFWITCVNLASLFLNYWLGLGRCTSSKSSGPVSRVS